VILRKLTFREHAQQFYLFFVKPKLILFYLQFKFHVVIDKWRKMLKKGYARNLH